MQLVMHLRTRAVGVGVAGHRTNDMHSLARFDSKLLESCDAPETISAGVKFPGMGMLSQLCTIIIVNPGARPVLYNGCKLSGKEETTQLQLVCVLAWDVILVV